MYTLLDRIYRENYFLNTLFFLLFFLLSSNIGAINSSDEEEDFPNAQTSVIEDNSSDTESLAAEELEELEELQNAQDYWQLYTINYHDSDKAFHIPLSLCVALFDPKVLEANRELLQAKRHEIEEEKLFPNPWMAGDLNTMMEIERRKKQSRLREKISARIPDFSFEENKKSIIEASAKSIPPLSRLLKAHTLRGLTQSTKDKMTFIVNSLNAFIPDQEDWHFSWKRIHPFFLEHLADTYFGFIAQYTEQLFSHSRHHNKALTDSVNIFYNALQPHDHPRHLTNGSQKLLLKNQNKYNIKELKAFMVYTYFSKVLQNYTRYDLELTSLNHALAFDLLATEGQNVGYTALALLSLSVDIVDFYLENCKRHCPHCPSKNPEGFRDKYPFIPALSQFLWDILSAIEGYPNPSLDHIAYAEKPAANPNGLSWRSMLKRTVWNNLMDYCHIYADVFREDSYPSDLLTSITMVLLEDPEFLSLTYDHTCSLWVTTIRNYLCLLDDTENRLSLKEHARLVEYLLAHDKRHALHRYVGDLISLAVLSDTEEQQTEYFLEVFNVLADHNHDQESFMSDLKAAFYEEYNASITPLVKNTFKENILTIYTILGKESEKNKFLGPQAKKRQSKRGKPFARRAAGASSSSSQTVDPLVSSSLSLRTGAEKPSSSREISVTPDSKASVPYVSSWDIPSPQESETKHAKELAQHALNKQTDKKAKKEARRPAASSSRSKESRDFISEAPPQKEISYPIERLDYFETLRKFLNALLGKSKKMR